MSIIDDETGLTDVPFAPAISQQDSPGMLLKRARESLGLTIDAVAGALKLNRQWVLDLENNEYKQSAELIYIRGYLRAYASLLGLSAPTILDAFTSMGFDEPYKARAPKGPLCQHPVCSDAASAPMKFKHAILWGGVFVLSCLAFGVYFTKFRPISLNGHKKPTPALVKTGPGLLANENNTLSIAFNKNTLAVPESLNVKN